MSVSTTNNRISYNGDATTTVFSFPYKFLATSDIKVFVGGVLQTITTDYSVGTPSDSGANITFVSPPAVGTANIVFVREPDLLQSTDLPSNGPFPAESVETMSDKLTLVAQRLNDKFAQSLTTSDDETLAGTLPSKTARAGRYLSFDASGNPETVNSVVDITTVAGIAGDVTTVSGIAADVTTVAGIAADVSAVALIDSDVTYLADLYLGVKAADPLVNNQGGALVDGSFYFNSVILALKVYNLATTTWVVSYVPSTTYLERANNLSDLTDASAARNNLGLGDAAVGDIGVDVQAYDADTAKLDVDQNWTGAQRASANTDNDLSFDLTAGNNFKCTPTATGALTFTNIASAAGQSGYVLLDNSGAYAITAAAATKVGETFLDNVSIAGVYLISYFCDGTNVYVTASGALA